MHVRVVRGLQRQAAVVQYCHQLLFHWKRLYSARLAAVEVSHPRVPRLLVGAAQKAEIVDLEAGRAALIRGLEHQVLAADLVELEFLGVAAEHGAIESSGRPASGRW